jgi:integrase/recombinase XerD
MTFGPQRFPACMAKLNRHSIDKEPPMEPLQMISLCRTYHLSQRTIAQRLGVAESKVSSWKHGRQPMPMKHQTALQTLVDELQASPLPSPLTPALTPQVVTQFMQYLADECQLSPATRSCYKAVVSAFLQALADWGEDASILNLTPNNVRRFLSDRMSAGNIPRTCARLLSALKTFARFLTCEDSLPFNPIREMQSPRVRRRLPTVSSVQEVECLLEQPSRSTPTGLRDIAMLELAYGSGLRAAEIVSLPMIALHLDDGWLKVCGKGDKERLVPMGEPCIAALQAYLNNARERLLRGHPSNDAVFVTSQGDAMTRQGFWKLLGKYAKQAGITKPMSPHLLRHAFATHLLEGGADILSISALLGHSDISTTEIYTHVSLTHLRKEYQRFHPR